MQTRHRVPTIFNIYMLDVICCALGCVVRWQVSHQEAEEQTSAAQDARAQYLRASQDVESAPAEVRELQRTLSADRDKARQLALDLAAARRDHEAAQLLAASRLQDYEKTRNALKVSEAMAATLRTDLDRAGADATKKDKLTADLQARLTTAEGKVRTLEKEATAQQAAAEDAAKRVRDADAANKKLEQLLADVRSEGKESQAKVQAGDLKLKMLEQELERSRKEVTQADQRFRDLLASHDNLSKQLVASTKDLGTARATITSLEGDKTQLERDKSRLLNKAQALEAAVEQRFAGIELKGENVVFLIDMSGSMELTDSATRNPDKWPLVCEAIARLLRSLAGLQRYQVILFSDRPRYLFGHEGQWLKFDSESSARVTQDTLKKVTPKGETNLHAAFAEAFRFRPLGLDTIYIISDGLPNSGEGLPLTGEKLSDSQRTELLSRNLRQKLRTDWNGALPNQKRVRINTIGFFFESPDVGAFLWALAREHEGSFVGMSKP